MRKETARGAQLDAWARQLLALPPGWAVRLEHPTATSRAGFGRLDLIVSRGGHRLHLQLVDGPASGDAAVWREGLGLATVGPIDARLQKALCARFQQATEPTGLRDALRKALGALPSSKERFESANLHFETYGWDLYHHTESDARSQHGMMRLGFRCNQDCAFCWQGRDWPETARPWRDRMERLAARGVQKLVITGGEPTLYPELPEIIADATRRGWSTVLQTNATALSVPRVRARLVAAGLDGAFVSLHSADPTVSDTITQAKGTWKRTIRGIHGALEDGIWVRLNCVVEKRNLEGLVEHARFVVEHFGDAPGMVGVQYSHLSSSFDPDAFARLAVPLDAVRPRLLAAAQLLLAAEVDVEVLSGCGFPPCLFAKTPTLLRTLHQDFQPFERDGRNNGCQTCRQCTWRSACRGPRQEYLQVFGERGLIPQSTPIPSR